MRTINGILLTPSQLEEWQEMFAECDGDQQLADELWRHGHRHDGQQWIPIRHFANMEVDNDFVSEIEQQNVQSSPNDTRWNTLPLGLDQIEADASDRYRENSNRPLLKADQIRCCVRDCTSWLPLFHRRGDAGLSSCPEHGIRMSTSPTYVYRLRSRNFMVRADWPRRLKKVETWRLGNENSEDAVSWNVFVSLAELGALGPLFQLLTGVKPIAEAELYVWGNGLYGASHLSERLDRTRCDLEMGFEIPTEPDVMLRVPGQAVVLIEVKLGSANGTLRGKEKRRGSVEQFLARYVPAHGCLDPIARLLVKQLQPHEVLEQLCRNVVFAQHLAEPGEQPFVVNLVRDSAEVDIEQRFVPQLASPCPVKFRRATWEQINELPVISSNDAALLRRYFQNKTVNLKKAFNV